MSRWRLLLIVAPVVAVSYLVTVWSGTRGSVIVRELAVAFIPPVFGLLVAAVGVFLGGLGNVYAFLVGAGAARGDGIEGQRAIGLLAQEMRQNTLFSLAALAGLIALRLFTVVDIPGVKWPLTSAALSKNAVCDTASLTLSVLTLRAIWDCVEAMFTIYRHHEVSLTAMGKDRG